MANLPEEDKLIFQGGKIKSKQLAEYYTQIAKELNIEFIDAQSIIQVTDIDGIHWTAKQHQTFGEKVCSFVSELLK